MLDFHAVDRTEYGLPDKRQILSTQPAPLGWFACYVKEMEEDQDNPANTQASIIKIPVILWVTVRFQEDTIDYEEIRHFVADTDGGIMDYLDVDYPFLCVIDPSADFERAVKAALADFHAEADFPTKLMS